jgi:hypothetical protein
MADAPSGARSSSVVRATPKATTASTAPAPTTRRKRRRCRRHRPPGATRRRIGGSAAAAASRRSRRNRIRSRTHALLLPLLLLVMLVARPAASFMHVLPQPSSQRGLLLAALGRRCGHERSSRSCTGTTTIARMILLPPTGPAIPSRTSPDRSAASKRHGRRRPPSRCGATRNEGSDSDSSSSDHQRRDGPLAKGSSGSQLDVPPDELQRRAQRLREEVDAMRCRMEQARQRQLQKETDKADRWLEDVLVQHKINADTEILNTIEQAQEKLVEGRYSPDQVDQMFERLCQLSRVSGRDSLDRNARLQLLVEATGKVDELEPEVNPNKRWRGCRVEHELHKKLFAKEWGIDLDKKKTRRLDENSKDDDAQDERYWRTRRR